MDLDGRVPHAQERLVLNPFDSVSLDRVINVPPRRIGQKTIEELTAWAGNLEVPVYAALQTIDGVEGEGPLNSQKGVRRDR